MNFGKLLIIAVFFLLTSCAKVTTSDIRREEIPGDLEFAILDIIGGEGVISNVQHHETSDQEWYSVEYSVNQEVQEIFLTPSGDMIEEDPGRLF